MSSPSDRAHLSLPEFLRDLALPYDDALPSYKVTADRLREAADVLESLERARDARPAVAWVLSCGGISFGCTQSREEKDRWLAASPTNRATPLVEGGRPVSTDAAREELRERLYAVGGRPTDAQLAVIFDYFAAAPPPVPLRAALKRAARKFREYERLHLDKASLDGERKARANAREAEACEAALAGAGPDPVREAAQRVVDLEQQTRRASNFYSLRKAIEALDAALAGREPT